MDRLPARAVLLPGLMAALVLTACRSSPPAAAPVRTAAATAVERPAVDEYCGILTEEDGASGAQAPDGRLSGCFRVGPMRPGPYTLQLEHSVFVEGHEPVPSGGISLVPAQGPPGTTVEIAGFSPAARAGPEPPNNSARVCWDGCDRGFSHFETVTWSPDGHFTTRLEVPAVPWLAVDGPHPLRSGAYRITLGCLPTCGSQPVEAVFHLRTGEPRACVANRPCAHLELSRDAARPGEVVRISAWAPLLPPPANHYVLHVGEGHTGKPPVGTFAEPYGATVRLAAARFDARSGRRWSDVPALKPASEDPGRPGLAAAADDARLLAHCVPDGIRMSHDGGVHWDVVDTRTAPMAAQGTGYRLASAGSVLCDAPVPDPRQRRSAFARFTLARQDVEPPPFYSAGFFTVDEGRTWRPVPVPPGSTMENFDGFGLSGGAVLARFRQRPEPSQWARRDNAPARDWDPRFTVLTTSDGGRHWTPGPDPCPARGRCVTWGPTADYSCAKGRSYRLLRTSGDGGRTWASASWPGWVATCDAVSLVNLAGGGMLLLAADGLAEPFAVRLTADGGRTWEPIELPALPDASPTAWPHFPNLTMLGDGRLLAFAFPSGAQLLEPGADRWCAVDGDPLGPRSEAQGRTYESVGNRLWWVDWRTQAARSVPYGALRCR